MSAKHKQRGESPQASSILPLKTNYSQMRERIEVLYLNYIPCPYRVDFFNELAKSCELSVVYYQAEIEERPNWQYDASNHHYEHSVLFEKEGRFELKGYLKLVQIFKKKRDSIIIVGGYAQLIEIFAIFYLHITRKPFILNTDGGFFQGGKLKLLLKRWLVKKASYYLANGTLAAQTLQQYGANPKLITNYHFTSLFEQEVLPASLTTDERKKIKEQLSIPDDAFVIITIGRYIPLKGFELVIEAVHQLNNKSIHLYMLGEGPMRAVYEKLADQYSLQNNVKLTGELSKDDVLNYCKMANVMILPTLTSDVWGLVLNEAMSCGLPVIASDRVGAAYDLVIDGVTGYMVSSGSSIEIANAIKKIRSQSTVLSSNALELSRSYTIEQMTKDHINLFNSIIANN